MDPTKLIEMQVQMQRNNSDIQSFLTGLDSWTEDIKKKDDNLKIGTSAATGTESETQKLPPVRNSLLKKKKKRKPKTSNEDIRKGPKRISGFDFRAWDKYDADKAIEEISGDEGCKTASSGEETDEEWEIERRVQQALIFKDQGNLAFKNENYDEAIEHYTRGIECDPENALLPANRAMALIKQEKFAAAEADCTGSLVLDPLYVKAYSRRGTARVGLGRNKEALKDFEKVILLEPKNAYAQTQKRKLSEKLNPPTSEPAEVDPDAGIVQAIYKPPDKRSKKPLRRVEIEEIGVDNGQTIKDAIAQTEASQGETKRKVTEKGAKLFERFMTSDPTTTTTVVKTESCVNEVVADTSDQAPQTFSSPGDIMLRTRDPESTTVQQQTTPDGGERTRPGHVTTQTPASLAESPKLPNIPSSSFHFQADWKVLKNQPQRFYQYFKRIDPSQYGKLVGTALNADILNAILRMLHDFYLPDNVDIYPVLLSLPAVKRFSMTVMFMSAKDKEVLRSLFEHMKASGRNTDDIDRLSKKYEL